MPHTVLKRNKQLPPNSQHDSQPELTADAAKQLALQAGRGDRAAFSRLVGVYYHYIYALSYRLCGHKQDAEDLTQSVCIKLASVIGQYQGNAAFKTWLYRVVINLGRDHLRKRRTDAMPLLEDDIYKSDAPSVESALVSKAAYKAVLDLPEKYREAVLLVFAEGLSHGEAAKVLGCSEGNVSWRIHEARKRLGEALKDLWP